MPARIPTAELLKSLQNFAECLEKTPTAADMRSQGEFSAGVYISRFGSWNDAIAEAGLTTNFEYDSESHRTSKEDFLEEIRRVAEEVGYSPTHDEFEELAKYSTGPYYARFESWVQAKREAGVGEYRKEPDLVSIECDQCGESLERFPSQIHDTTFCGKECHDEWQRENCGGEGSLLRERVEVECAECGTTLKRKPSRAEKYERQFCDMECQGKWKSRNHRSERSPAFKRVNVDCAWCETTLSFPPSRVERSTNLFCDMDCRRKWLSENRRGDDSHSYNRVQVDCEICDSTLLRVPSRVEQTNYQFCDRVCKAEWHSKEYRGEKHPRWKGGYEPYYGSNWLEQRRVRREIDDYRCQACGQTEQDHIEEFDRELEVHHIRRKGDFDTPEEANALDNLVTLCRRCHKKWEGIELRPTFFDE